MRSQTFGILIAIKYGIRPINAFLRKLYLSASGNFMAVHAQTPYYGALPLEPTGGLPSQDALFYVSKKILKLYRALRETLSRTCGVRMSPALSQLSLSSSRG